VRLLRSRAFYAVAAAALCLVFVAMQMRCERDPRPLGTIGSIAGMRERRDLNVLFIIVDTLRADRLGSFGYARDTSPHLDAVAERGIRFANHTAQSSWTKSSMAALWTGLYPARSGVYRHMHALPPEARLPAEILRDAGIRTIGIWRNGWVAPNFGFDQGFEVYSRPIAGPPPANVRRDNPAATLGGSDADVTGSALEFLRTVGKDTRWLLYLHYMDVHQYVSDPESARFGTSYSDFYDNAIHWTDRNIGALLDDLARRNFLQRTLVVVTSDHGEAFREHGTEGHARNLYGEVIEIPLIVGLPFRLAKPIVVEAPTESVDVWPTILDLLGLPPLDDPDGQSLVPIIEAAARGEVLEPARTRFADLDTSWGNPSQPSERIFAITRGRYRGQSVKADGFELYDLETDPGEQRDIAADEPEAVAELRASLAEHGESADPPWKPREVELDQMLLNQLRALGYRVE
jgi:arylsulfatase A-like enzyme